MAPRTVNIIGPGGEEATVLVSSLDAWTRNGWTEAPANGKKPAKKPAAAAKPASRRSSARSDSAETLDSAG